jgi:hypothetical protein
MSTQDTRQVMIVFQSSLTRAVEILIHNSGGEPIDPREVIKLGWKMTKTVINPEHAENMLKEDSKA